MSQNLRRSFFFLIIIVSALPVSAQKRNLNITDFTISRKQEKVVLDWKTNAGAETNYFAIQKSTDGINYKTIAFVLGADPKQNCDCYGAFDKKVNTAKQFYRLVHISQDGSEQYSETKAVSNP